MTMVRTPPPLPVRDKAAARALSPMLNRLAEERATGVLVREHGTLYLAEGRVVHAESPLAPGLDVLLTAHGTLAGAAWQRAAGAAEGPLRAAELLLESGLLPAGALELCHLDALYDAGYFALAPSSTPGRFHYEGEPRTGPLPSVPVVALERETLRRRLQLHRLWPDPAADTAPLIRADPAPTRQGRTGPPSKRPGRPTPVAPRQRAVLDRVDGTRTAADIALDLGRQAFHTLVDVRRLAAAGHLRPLAPAAPAPAPPAPTAPEQARNLPPPLLPVTDPDIALLKRLRDALEAL
ncbi:transcriptional regulator [Streptomyces sp. AM6-12]|uniref:transcriptional regulator n=1 Tax=Streptomyces sp. AM6-12 TaxID=3345149 RepID=UPI0037B27143